MIICLQTFVNLFFYFSFQTWLLSFLALHTCHIPLSFYSIWDLYNACMPLRHVKVLQKRRYAWVCVMGENLFLPSLMTTEAYRPNKFQNRSCSVFCCFGSTFVCTKCTWIIYACIVRSLLSLWCKQMCGGVGGRGQYYDSLPLLMQGPAHTYVHKWLISKHVGLWQELQTGMVWFSTMSEFWASF